VQQKQRLRGLFPQCGVVVPKPLEGTVVNVGQAKKATSQVTDRHGKRAISAICLLHQLRFKYQRWQLSFGTGFSPWCDGHRAMFEDDFRLDPEEIGLDRDDPPQARQNSEASRNTSSRSTAVQAS
jgi:hypothetical protein